MIHHFWGKKIKIFENNKIIKLVFQLVFSTYLPKVLLKFRVGVLIGCKIQFLIQGAPMLHTFDGLCYTKNEKYMKKHDCNHVFHVFLNFHVAGSIKSMQHGYSLDRELNFASNEYSHLKFE